MIELRTSQGKESVISEGLALRQTGDTFSLSPLSFLLSVRHLVRSAISMCIPHFASKSTKDKVRRRERGCTINLVESKKGESGGWIICLCAGLFHFYFFVRGSEERVSRGEWTGCLACSGD